MNEMVLLRWLVIPKTGDLQKVANLEDGVELLQGSHLQVFNGSFLVNGSMGEVVGIIIPVDTID